VLNLRLTEKINTGLIWLAAAFTLLALVLGDFRWLIGTLVAVLPVIVTSWPLYDFYARCRGVWFAVRVVPVHLLYYFLNGISVLWGVLLHHTIGEPKPPPDVQAFAEVGVETWPPIPSKTPRGPWQQPARRPGPREDGG
jgi:hypothetical protein